MKYLVKISPKNIRTVLYMSFHWEIHIINNRLIEDLRLTMSYPMCEFNIFFGNTREIYSEERGVLFGSAHCTL